MLQHTRRLANKKVFPTVNVVCVGASAHDKVAYGLWTDSNFDDLGWT